MDMLSEIYDEKGFFNTLGFAIHLERLRYMLNHLRNKVEYEFTD